VVRVVDLKVCMYTVDTDEAGVCGARNAKGHVRFDSVTQVEVVTLLFSLYLSL